MTDTRLIGRLRQILSDVAPELDVAAIPDEADLRNDIGIDSMDFLNFVIGISKQLSVAIPEADYGKITTLAKCADYIGRSKTVAG
ncbi:MAG: acyl carrier protein [Proteobacteria bacterium]|nr:acyl carrier protein [Pseudomonadota bacterium]